MKQPLIVLTGPTASGKTGLALELAERFYGEIICADSRTIYKGMDIGTAKPTREEQARVPHHLLDVVEPGERFTAADFQRRATSAIADIRRRGKVPFLVGGTGLYIDAIVLDFKWPALATKDEALTTKTVGELQVMLKKQHIPLPENKNNKRHLINALSRVGSGSARAVPLENTIVVAIATDKAELKKRMRKRAEVMFSAGVIEETQKLMSRFGSDSEAMKSNIYPIVRRLIEGDITRPEAIELFVTKDLQLAKRQVTWLRRHGYVMWLSLEEARAYIATVLNKMC